MMQPMTMGELVNLNKNPGLKEEIVEDMREEWRNDVERWNESADDSESDGTVYHSWTHLRTPLSLQRYSINHFLNGSDREMASHINAFRTRPINNLERALVEAMQEEFIRRLQLRNNEFIVRSGPRSIERRREIVHAFDKEIREQCKHLIYRTQHNGFGERESEQDFEYFINLMRSCSFENLNQITVQMETPITHDQLTEFFVALSSSSRFPHTVNLDVHLESETYQLDEELTDLFPRENPNPITVNYNYYKANASHVDAFENVNREDCGIFFSRSK